MKSDSNDGYSNPFIEVKKRPKQSVLTEFILRTIPEMNIEDNNGNDGYSNFERESEDKPIGDVST